MISHADVEVLEDCGRTNADGLRQREHDLLPWADPYIASLMASLEEERAASSSAMGTGFFGRMGCAKSLLRS